MSRYGNLPLKAALVLIFSGLAVPLHAADPGKTGADLYVCNKGSVAVEVVSATRGQHSILRGFDKYYWAIEGATAVPGKCTTVKNPDGDPSYIAFGFTDSKGEWGSGRIAQVPDLGSTLFNLFGKTEKIVTGAMRTMCVWKGATYYVLDNDFSIDCAHFTLPEASSPPVPLTSALYFHPDVRSCLGPDGFPVTPDGCDPMPYYLNISPSATDRELHATQGTRMGADALGSGDDNSSLCGKVSCTDLFLQGLAQAIKDNQAQQAANTNGPRSPRRPVIPPPQPPPPPRSASPRASTPDDDDPIGQGGFITRPSNPAPASARANSLQWVRTDVLAYIEASKTGFAAYKKGDVQVSQDLRMWESSVKPSAARGCWVVQGTTSTTLSCALSPPGDLNALRPYYADLNKEIAATLPRDWTQVEQPFGGNLPSQGYRSSSGAHLEVWIKPTDAAGVEEINFQLVSAH